LSPDEMVRHVITQPITCAPQYADMFRLQAYFFVELAIHGLHRAFAIFDAALWKLPCVFPDSLAPKDLVFAIDENNADIGTVAFTIKHGHPHRIQYNYRRLYVSVATFNYARNYLPS